LGRRLRERHQIDGVTGTGSEHRSAPQIKAIPEGFYGLG